jgi:hypothetical protein
MNENRRRVVLYGDSLILAGVRAGLEHCPDLHVISLDPSLDNLMEAVRACCPAAFVFDMDAVRPDFQLSLLETPGLRLVGIDPEAHRAVVWCGREQAAVAAADLIDLVGEREGSPGRSSEAAEQLEI